MSSDSPLEELQIPVVTRQDIEVLRDEAYRRSDLRLGDIARIALGESVVGYSVHPVDARDECVRVITAARRQS